MRRRALTPVFSLVMVLFAVGCAGAQKAPPKPLDVPYVPTPELVVAEMLEIAGVRGNDVLYDLGSGDGRIVITAARRFGTRGVGYDIDPERVREAKANAQEAGVTDKVRFVQGDIFDADIKDASVVTLYLLPVVNLRLRPKLLRDLKPGTRIVSHNYDMGDWTPEQTRRMIVNGTEHTVYLWTVPPKAAAR
jgi:trans-aconitate methyltransferase